MLWGVAFGNIVYALLGGATTLALFVTHGAVFVALKTDGPIRADARRVAGVAGLAAVASAVAFLGWTQVAHGDAVTAAVAAVASVALLGALLANRLGREGWAFVATAVTIVAP